MLVGLTEWNEFRALDLKQARGMMRGNVLVDLRNMYPEASAEEAGFVYYGMGRTPPPQASRARNRRASLELGATYFGSRISPGKPELVTWGCGGRAGIASA